MTAPAGPIKKGSCSNVQLHRLAVWECFFVQTDSLNNFALTFFNLFKPNTAVRGEAFPLCGTCQGKSKRRNVAAPCSLLCVLFFSHAVAEMGTIQLHLYKCVVWNYFD